MRRKRDKNRLISTNPGLDVVTKRQLREQRERERHACTEHDTTTFSQNEERANNIYVIRNQMLWLNVFPQVVRKIRFLLPVISSASDSVIQRDRLSVIN